MLKKSVGFALACSVVLLLVGGCARNISSSSYDARTVGSSSRTYECYVVSARVVDVNEGDYLEDNKTGMLVGAVAGGGLGNMIGKGKGRVASTIAAGLIGTAAGAMIEKNLKYQQGMEYTVKLKDGSMRTVVQGLDNRLNPGQRALLIEDSRGRSRVVAN